MPGGGADLLGSSLAATQARALRAALVQNSV